ncbi:hypothetical protein SOASR032_15310 [Pragia fontium]|uniref:Flagellar hook-length control protein-like C-terminal domain-containing protein n=1 Tax=Pragia fontium TaxID=82985 RepID=A0ABQ5LJE8_9GAMM|nr:flagellar hook-length control protein FliK [Pragia fontium]GKX62962.1 hypothetical protein SOASR032_15310 [Pragia fontium]
MNINSFAQFSSPASGQSSAQASPLENLMGLLSSASQGQDGATFSLTDLLPALTAHVNEMADKNSDLTLPESGSEVQIDPALLLENLSAGNPQEGIAALLAYLVNGEVPKPKTGDVNAQPQDASVKQTTPMNGATPVITPEMRQSLLLNNGLVAQGPAMPAANVNLTELLNPTPMLRTENTQPEVAATTTPLTMVRSLLDKTEGSSTVSSASSSTSLVSIMTGLPNSLSTEDQTVERTANWSTVKMQPRQENWSQQLHSVLSDRLQIQSDNRIQHATIRLDPPDMGKIDISLHMDGGKLQVQINANQNDIYKALQQISHELRQTLVEQNFTQVSVQITSNGQQQQQGQHRQANGQPQEPEIAKQSEAEESAKPKDDTILTTA